jgi:glyoxylase-like metal-dependent hydrolase (beta-lactamase superfamily II)
MFLEVFADNPYATNCWLLAADGRDDALVVDPGFFADRVLDLLRAAGKRPAGAIATHGHIDHIGAAAELCGDAIPLYIHEADEPALTNPVAWGAGYGDPVGRPSQVRTVSDGDVISSAGFEVEVIHTPGHTPGSVCYRVPELVFSGDLVFRGTIGRFDFPNSSEKAMFASLRRFLQLPDDLDVLPGHLARTTVGQERATNEFLRGVA